MVLTIKNIILSLDLVLILYVADDKEFVMASVFFYLVASWLHLFFHEIGHFIGGCLTGYELLYIRIPFFFIERKHSGGYNFYFIRCFSGQCVMTPNMQSNRDVPYILYNVGGVVFNFLLCVMGLFYISINSRICSMFFLQVIFAGVVKIFVNVFPNNNQGLTDGYILKTLFRNRQTQFDYYKYLKLFSHYYLNEKFRLRDYMYSREMNYKNDDLIFYLEIKKILQKTG